MVALILGVIIGFVVGGNNQPQLGAEGDTNLTNLVLSGDLTVDDASVLTGATTLTGAVAHNSTTNTYDGIGVYIERKDINFDDVLGFREGFAKGKDHFDYIKNKYNFDNRDLVFIGDSLKDAERAYSNNVDFIAKAGLFSKEDFKVHLKNNSPIIHSLKELTKE